MITIQGINLEVTEPLREHVEYHVEKLSKYNTKNDLNFKVNLSVLSKDKFDVDVIVEGKSITGGAVSDNMYTAITTSFENVETMLARRKGKELSKRHKKIVLTNDEE